MTDTCTRPSAPVSWQTVRRYEDIRFERDGGLAKITICRPEVRNAFRPKTLFELIDAFSRAREDGTIGVIIFTGEGDLAFCSGGAVPTTWRPSAVPASPTGRRGSRRACVLSGPARSHRCSTRSLRCAPRRQDHHGRDAQRRGDRRPRAPQAREPEAGDRRGLRRVGRALPQVPRGRGRPAPEGDAAADGR